MRSFNKSEEEELLEADLIPLLMRGPRNGGKGSGGKAAQPAASVRLVARKVAERPPFFQIRVRGHALFHCAARLGHATRGV